MIQHNGVVRLCNTFRLRITKNTSIFLIFWLQLLKEGRRAQDRLLTQVDAVWFLKLMLRSLIFFASSKLCHKTIRFIFQRLHITDFSTPIYRAKLKFLDSRLTGRTARHHLEGAWSHKKGRDLLGINLTGSLKTKLFSRSTQTPICHVTTLSAMFNCTSLCISRIR